MNIKFVTLILFLLPSCLSAKDCSKQKDDLGFYWTQRPIRTQGGGYIWFLGKGTHSVKSTAKLLSEGDALDLLKKECLKISEKVKFIERCYETKGDLVIYYSRASIASDFCKNDNVKTNQALEQTLKDYKNTISKIKPPNCSEMKNKEVCLELASKDVDRGNWNEAIEKLSYFCNKNINQACIKMQLPLIKIGNTTLAKKYAEILCNTKNSTSCWNYAQTALDPKSIDYLHYVHRSCKYTAPPKGSSIFCVKFLQILMETSPKNYPFRKFLETVSDRCKRGYSPICREIVSKKFEDYLVKHYKHLKDDLLDMTSRNNLIKGAKYIAKYEWDLKEGEELLEFVRTETVIFHFLETLALDSALLRTCREHETNCDSVLELLKRNSREYLMYKYFLLYDKVKSSSPIIYLFPKLKRDKFEKSAYQEMEKLYNKYKNN